MSLIPELKIGLLNGWILSTIVMTVNYLLLFVIAPKENVKEMLDQVKQLKGKHKLLNSLAYIPQYLIYIYSIFLALKLDASWFYVGLALFVSGMICEIIAVVQLFFRKPGQLMTKGFYRFSRNPLYVAWFIICIGIGTATASWVIIVFAVFSMIVNHFIVLAEESICLKKYGDAYREYMKRVPRYILFF